MNQFLTNSILFCLWALPFGLLAQYADVEFEDAEQFKEAYDLAYDGKHEAAKKLLKDQNNSEAQFLTARMYSWNGQYDKARKEFNRLTSKEKNNASYWIGAVKNELYAKNYALALGLVNKAMQFVKGEKELQRLKNMALDGIANISYGTKGWYNTDGGVQKKGDQRKKSSQETAGKKPPKEKDQAVTEIEEEKHRVGIRNAFTVFNERFDPVVFSTLSYAYLTKVGRIIPKINYNNRSGVHGLQYDIDFYPKFAKGLYAYLNYGYSNAPIFPRQKFGGDLYLNLPNAMEISAGGRYISTATRNIKAITNSLGYYKGNYYFSLRSFVSPRDNNLWSVSGNLLVRKYFRDGENFFGISGGLGFTPELQQLFNGDTLLSETLLFVGSQRLNFQYQFTPKKSPNIYRANLGVRRQEFTSNAGTYFWAFSAGLTYLVKF